MQNNGIKLGEGLKDAAITAGLVLLMALPIIGLRTQTAVGGLTLNYEWDRVLVVVAVAAVGRLLLTTFWPYIAAFLKSLPARFRPQTERGRTLVRPEEKPAFNFLKWLGIGLFAVGLFWPIINFENRYLADLGILVMTYIMLGWGLNIVVGLAGLLDLGYVAFYAVGAYTYALLATEFGFSFWLCLPVAGVLACFWGVILGFPVLRLRGDYLAIVTLAFGEIIRIVLLNWYQVTGGPDGINRIPRPTLFGLEFSRTGDLTFHEFFGIAYSPMYRIIFLYYLIFILAFITHIVSTRLRKLPLGRAWEAMREDEIACRSLGINIVNTKLTAFAIGATFGGFAGAFFATRQGFISPESFSFIESALILFIVVLGGLGSQIGVVISAIIMIGGIEFFRDLDEYRMLIFGLATVLIMIRRPRGLIATREPSIYLKEKKSVSAGLVAQGHG